MKLRCRIEIAACKSLFLEQRVRSEWNLASGVWFFFVFFLVLLEAVSSIDRKKCWSKQKP